MLHFFFFQECDVFSFAERPVSKAKQVQFRYRSLCRGWGAFSLHVTGSTASVRFRPGGLKKKYWRDLESEIVHSILYICIFFLSFFLGVPPQMHTMKGSRFALNAQLELSICCALAENPHAEIKPLLFWSLISSAASLKSKCWFDASQMFFF